MSASRRIGFSGTTYQKIHTLKGETSKIQRKLGHVDFWVYMTKLVMTVSGLYALWIMTVCESLGPERFVITASLLAIVLALGAVVINLLMTRRRHLSQRLEYLRSLRKTQTMRDMYRWSA